MFEYFGTFVYIIIILLSLRMYYIILKPKNKYVYSDVCGRVDIIVPAVYPDIAIENTKHLEKSKYVNKIIIVTPDDGFKSKGKYVFVKDGKKGRAEAINLGLDYVESDVVLVIDEDLYVPEETIIKGLCVMREYDIVKLNLVPKKCRSVFHRLVKIDRLFTETVSQPKTKPHFGGTGFIKTKVLKDLKFDNSFLTEDIELTVRAYLKGYKVKTFDDLYAYEDYPDFKGWLIQRRRWAAGWFQVFVRHFGDLKNRDVFELMWSQCLVFLPVLMIIGMFTGNIFSPYVNTALCVFCILPLFIIGFMFDKKYFFLYPIYFFTLCFYSIYSVIRPPKKYVVTPK